MPETANTTAKARPSERISLRQSRSPHIHDAKSDSRRVMQDVLLALTPAALGSVYLFAGRILLYYAIAVGVAVALDCIVGTFVRKKQYRFDWTPVVTGVLLAMSLPANVPLWFPALGSAVAILIAKELFGGTGKNILNPAVTGRLALRLFFVEQMTRNAWPQPGIPVPAQIDAISGATPLMVLKEGATLDNASLLATAFGNTGGKLGETSAVLLLAGAAFLLWRGVIRWRIPAAMLSAIALGAVAIGVSGGQYGELPSFVAGHLLGGATILGAFFMATDYASSPSTPSGQLIFGIGVGAITMAYRYFSPYSEGFTFALFFMNLLVPVLNRRTVPRVFGY